mmetsp:Transcript_7368/g.18287  ORF Transcript_7368/g.18287 Transcript_7368/m.18287 type:complete len:280 (-) Transcript_7368:230-1069(-)
MACRPRPQRRQVSSRRQDDVDGQRTLRSGLLDELAAGVDEDELLAGQDGWRGRWHRYPVGWPRSLGWRWPLTCSALLGRRRRRLGLLVLLGLAPARTALGRGLVVFILLLLALRRLLLLLWLLLVLAAVRLAALALARWRLLGWRRLFGRRRLLGPLVLALALGPHLLRQVHVLPQLVLLNQLQLHGAGHVAVAPLLVGLDQAPDVVFHHARAAHQARLLLLRLVIMEGVLHGVVTVRVHLLDFAKPGTRVCLRAVVHLAVLAHLQGNGLFPKVDGQLV